MLSKRLSAFTVKYPKTIVAVLLLVTCTLGYFASTGLSLRVVLEDMLPVGRENVKLISRFGQQFGGANTTLIAVENTRGTIYDAKFLAKYKRISDDVYFHPDVYRYLVQSLALRKTKAVSGSSGRIEIDALMWPNLPKTPADMERLRKNVHAQYLGSLVSNDEHTAMIVADFKDNTNYEALVDHFSKIAAREGGDGIRIHMAGRPILLGNIYKALDSTIVIFGISLLLVGVILYAYFNTWIGVVVPMISAAVALLWGLGAMGAFKYNVDPLLILLPAFIFAIVLSHSVQFVSRVLEEFGEHHHMRDAVEHGLEKMIFPSLTAIITAAAGFSVQVLVGIPSIQALAVICAIWILSIGPAIILAAALLCLLPKPTKYRFGIHLIERMWSALKLERHGKAVVVISLALLAFGIYGAQKLTIGDDTGSPILWSDSRYNKDTEFVNSHFSFLGTDMMQVFIQGGDNAMADPAVYHRIEALDRYTYERVEQARPAQSLVPVIKKINEVLYEGDPSYEFIPDTPEEVGFNIYLFRSKGEPGDFAAYTDPEWRIGNLSIPVKDHSGKTVDKIIGTVKNFLSQAAPLKGGTQFLYAGGQIGITKAMNDELRASNMKVMIAIIIVISLCTYALYRSIAIVGVILVSLGIANFLTYAFMAYRGIGLSVNTLPLTALGIGLGVDYGIYILFRIREEFRHGRSVMDAVTCSIRTSGNAVFITAMAMILPLLPWFFSELRFQAEMGLLLGMVLFLNMVGALVFVPAAVLVMRPAALFDRSRHLLTDEFDEEADEAAPAPGEAQEVYGSNV